LTGKKQSIAKQTSVMDCDDDDDDDDDDDVDDLLFYHKYHLKKWVR